MAPDGNFGALLVLGPPGVGKSLFLRLLAEQLGASAVALNVGEELRQRGLVQPYLAAPTGAGRQALGREAHKLVAEACRRLKDEQDSAAGPKYLLLEAVKDEEDGCSLLDTLHEHEVPLLQVVLLHSTVREPLCRRVAGSRSRLTSGLRDDERMVEERQAKWNAHSAALIELFSAQGVLLEAVEAPRQAPFSSRGGRRRSDGYGMLPSASFSASQAAPAGSLAAIGYAGASTGVPVDPWLRQVGLCGADGRLLQAPDILLRCVEPVVSTRLVSSGAERRGMLQAAATSSGLLSLGQGPLFAVPQQSVRSPPDARWLAYPGRYLVTRKCDGTRCLLIVPPSGTPYLLNRAGTLYRYPNRLSCSGGSSSGSADSSQGPSLPPGTILDGELVWVGPPGAVTADRRGFFLAFDALALGQQRTWQQPLPERLAALASLGLGEAEQSAELRSASSGSADAGSGSGSGTSDSGAASSGRGTGGSGAAASGSGSGGTSSTSLRARLSKKQQAPPPGNDSVLLLRKRHLPVSPEAIEELGSSQAACPYPTDGLVFTPTACPYALGTAELLLKWQLPEEAAADVTGTQLQEGLRQQGHRPSSAALRRQGLRATGGREALPAGVSAAVAAREREEAAEKLIASLPKHLVYECRLLHPPAPPATAATAATAARADVAAETAAAAGLSPAGAEAQRQEMRRMQEARRSMWQPCSIRWDKRSSNQPSAIEATGRSAVEGRYLTLPMLVGAVRETQQALAASPPDAPQAAAGSEAPAHPARSMPFAALLAAVSAEVEAGTVELTVDSTSGLHIYCYRQSLGPPRSAVAAMCRGLVLHPASHTVVASPFTRFDELGQTSAAAAAAAASTRLSPRPGSSVGGSSGREEEEEGSGAALPGSPADQENLAMYASSSGRPASASLKLDGSLITAFLWDSQPQAATRRRMDSEQALWARDWLRQHLRPEALQPGWTYLFEALYPDNTHVVPYPFEACVLLSAVGPDGRELPRPAARQALAARLGVAAAPAVEGLWAELLARLGRGAAEPLQEGKERLPPAFEGWVLQDAASGQRLKLVQAAFKAAGAAIRQRLHPLALWDAIRCGGASHEQLVRGLPAHARGELARMLDALQAQYSGVQRRLEAALAQHEQQHGATAASTSRRPSGGRGRGSCSPSSSRQAQLSNWSTCWPVCTWTTAALLQSRAPRPLASCWAAASSAQPCGTAWRRAAPMQGPCTCSPATAGRAALPPSCAA
ncbi:hypothetical protein ABPG75_001658 [Micractinium tetrahymenae]